MRPARDKSDSATTRRLALRMRPDLSVQAQQYGPDRYWLVKDPVALRYFHLCEEEHAILRMLDGRASLADIKRRFEEAFAPLQVTAEHLHAFLSRLYESGLLLAEAPGQGEQLLQRHTRRRRRAWLDFLGNLLAFRFGGVDPDRFLRWLSPRCRWFFSAWFLGEIGRAHV
jgi:putative peptide zinc metalloprotease protein